MIFCPNSGLDPEWIDQILWIRIRSMRIHITKYKYHNLRRVSLVPRFLHVEQLKIHLTRPKALETGIYSYSTVYMEWKYEWQLSSNIGLGEGGVRDIGTMVPTWKI